MHLRLKSLFGAGAALLTLAWIIPASAKSGTWPQVGYDAGHSGYNASEVTINAGNVATLANAGEFGTTLQVDTQPVVSNGIVYVDSSDNYLYAYDVATGQLAWKVDAGTNIDAPTGMVLSGSRIIVSCAVGNSYGLCAFSAKTGKSLWKYAIGGSFTPPAISGSTIYFGTSGAEGNGVYADNIVALDATSGIELWRLWDCNQSVTCVGFGGQPPVLDKGLVYIACYGGADSGYFITVQGICAVNTSDGQLVWQDQIGAVGHPNVTGFSAKGGTIYVSYVTANCYQCNYTINVTALDGATGSVNWDMPITGTLNGSYSPTGAPAFGPNGTLYQVISDSNDPNQPNLFALNEHSGALKWSMSTALALWAPATIVSKGSNEVLFYTCGGNTCAYDGKNGSLLWESPQSQGNNFAPAVTGGAVYNNCGYNNMCVYTLQ